MRFHQPPHEKEISAEIQALVFAINESHEIGLVMWD